MRSRPQKAADLQLFIKGYRRKAQKRVEPNDRKYSREVEQVARRLPAYELDALLRDGDD